jgi:undecaprenyl phosphate N,N'-diacetylbacillosamine 1-phosphate transferase
MEYLPRYTPEQAKRHEVRPGITGLAQVNGRNAIQWAERFSMDAEYVRNLSFVADASIVFRTVIVVLRREGIAPNPNSPVGKFSDGFPPKETERINNEKPIQMMDPPNNYSSLGKGR